MRLPALRYSNSPARSGSGSPPGKAPTAAADPLWCFDFRDVRAEVGEQLAAVRTRDLVGDFDDPQPVEGAGSLAPLLDMASLGIVVGARHAGSPMAFGSMY